ncbi:MFS transporter [Ralstonia holmesii]|uniref:MFS transporter n=1 Tax=Ralstonia TaxID=48736 RepID=UPI0004692049|nr:MFS transporter [Ralstonia pickettii]
MRDVPTAPLPPPAERAVWPTLVVLLAMVFVVALGYGAGLPLLQLYLSQYLGNVTRQTLAWHVGMLGGVYTLALFVFAPWWGRQSDRHGRAVVLIAGFATYLLGTAAAALTPSLAMIYVSRLIAGAGAAAIVPGAQAYVTDISDAVQRSRRFVLIGNAASVGFLAGPAFGSWLSGPVMGVRAGQMAGMVNWPALAVVTVGLPLLLTAPRCLQSPRPTDAGISTLRSMSRERRQFVGASMLLATLASFATGTFEVGFSLFGGQTLGLSNSTMAAMFVTCSLAMLGAQSLLLFPAVRRRIDQRWVAGAFIASAAALGFAALVPGAGALGLLIAVVATGIGMIGPVLSYELLERDRTFAGSLLARQAAAGNLGQALGSVGAGSLFGWNPLAPFWAAAAILLLGSLAALRWWGVARQAERSLAPPQAPRPGTRRTAKGRHRA